MAIGNSKHFPIPTERGLFVAMKQTVAMNETPRLVAPPSKRRRLADGA
jgi:hypothetical protein